MNMLRCASVTILTIVLSGCSMQQQKIESDAQRAADAAAAAADAAAEANAKILAAEAAPRLAADRKRREEECVANSKPVHGRMLSALVIEKASLHQEASSQSKVIGSLTPGEQVKLGESSGKALDGDGQRWAHVETDHLVGCSPYANITGWLDEAAVVEAKDFKPVNRWDGPTRLDVEAGDWAGTYYFAVDGTYRSDEYQGKLYRHGDVFLGRADLNGQKTIDVFLWVEDRGVCWGADPAYCQR
jgi:hypothetical protein